MENTYGGRIGGSKTYGCGEVVLAASSAVIPDKEGYWLGFHMERFVKHARKTGELLDLPTASEGYLNFIKTAVPAPPGW